jgi:DNA (cytosine-5)-methyltransferase 1
MTDSRPTVLSLFSGVGGFDMGLESAGMHTVYQCEIDKHCRSVLDRHWPHVPKWSDISTLTGDEILSHAPEIDVVAWGSPCQDLSQAGKRAGLDGMRSSLFHEGIRIITEIRKATDGKYPRISIWENVYGALTSNKGADFRVILAEMAKAGSLFSEWRVLDAQFFGIPQRRRRVFVISVFDTAVAERCIEPILPITESVRRHTATRSTKKQGAAATTSVGIRAHDEWNIELETVGALQAHLSKNASADDAAHGLLISAQSVDDSLIIFENSYRDNVRVSTNGVTSTLSAKMGTGGNNTPMLVFDTQFGSNANVTEDVSPTLKSSQQAPSVAYSIREDAKANNFSATEITTARALQATQASPQSHHAQTFITDETLVRRLTPLECERLMGWPDDHTRYRADGSEQADTHRYKQIGNGVASPVAQWIGEQIVMHL